MKKILGSKRLRIIIITGLAITALTVIIILTIAGEKENVAISENTNTQTPNITVEESTENEEAISMLDESDVFKTEIEATAVNNIEPEQTDGVQETDEEESTVKPTRDASQNEHHDIEENDTTPTPDANQDEEQNVDEPGEGTLEPDETATYKDPDHEEEDSPQTVGAKLVDGVAVPMTNAEVDDFLRKIYATQSLEEYKTLMDTVIYFNVGIDTTRLVWHENYNE